MNLLIIVKSSACNKVAHDTVDFIVKRAIENKDVSIDGIFFRSDAVSISSTELQKRSDLLSIQDIYKKLNEIYKINLFVCGGDLQEKGISPVSVDKAFNLSGNVELSMMISNATKVVEF